MQQVDPLTIVQKLEKSCAATQVSVSTLPSIKSHEFYFELFAHRKSEWLSVRMASRLATSASYGIIGCLGGGHDKENEQHARENTPVGSNEFNRKRRRQICGNGRGSK